MDERYLFRAKRTDNGEWVEGYYVYNEKHYIGAICTEHNVVTAISWHEVIPSTICQCTGLKDRNGNMIWENDIVGYEDTIIGKQKLDRIVWKEYHAGFYRVHKSKMGLQYFYMNGCLGRDFEVIGNIFDNPELLKQEG